MYEEYREVFKITEWRDGCIYKTVSLGHGWFSKDIIDINKPDESNLIYAAASDDFARENMTIRRIS
jgi:hypothetical protein